MPKVIKEKRAIKLSGILDLADNGRNVYFRKVENHITVSDILKPIFWTHIAAQLRKNDRVELVPEDGSWYAELMVISTSANTARVVPLRIIQVDGSPIAALEDYYIKYGNGDTKFRIHRSADKTVVASGFQTTEEAHAHLASLTESALEKVA